MRNRNLLASLSPKNVERAVRLLAALVQFRLRGLQNHLLDLRAVRKKAEMKQRCLRRALLSSENKKKILKKHFPFCCEECHYSQVCEIIQFMCCFMLVILCFSPQFRVIVFRAIRAYSHSGFHFGLRKG